MTFPPINTDKYPVFNIFFSILGTLKEGFWVFRACETLGFILVDCKVIVVKRNFVCANEIYQDCYTAVSRLSNTFLR